MVIGRFQIVLLFIIFAAMIRYFSKNMIVVLGLPLLIVNMMAFNNNSYYEGFKEGADDEEEKKDAKKKDADKKDADKKDADKKDAKKDDEKDVDESFEVGRAKNRGHKIDYASTIEDAYDQLNSILGKDGIKNLTQDTERLMQQQAQLAGSLKDMGPLMEKMGPMMEQVTNMMDTMPNTEGKDVMDKVKDMMKGLSNK
jgi:hypothetical protein